MIAELALWLECAVAMLTLGYLVFVDIPGLLRHGLAYCKLSEPKDR